MKSIRIEHKKKSRRPARILMIAFLILLAGGGAAWYFLTGPGKAKAAATQTGPSYHTATVRRGDIILSATGAGTLVASRSVDLSFSTSGTVAELDVQLGDRVTSGQVLAKLGNTVNLQTDVANYQVQLLQAQQALNSLQQNASISLAQAYQAWVTAQDTYQNALTESERTALARCSKQVNTKYALALQNAKDKLDLMTRWNYGSDQWINAKNDYDTAMANYNYCISYTPDEKIQASASLQLAKSQMDQAEQNYNTLKAASGIDPQQLSLAEAKVDQAKAQLAQAQQELAGTTLTAPIAGTVTYIAAGQGSQVDTSTFITISDLSQPTLNVEVDETDLPRLVVGSKTQVVFDALPDRNFTGTVTQVDPQLVQTGQYQMANAVVKLDPGSAKALQTLPLGLNATVTIISNEANGVLLVPLEAVRDLGNNQTVVFVLGQDGKLRLKQVKVGLSDTTQSEILSGLNEGDVVSTGIASTLQ